ncbi:hypothetical protein EWH99_12610 [Sporolactobacillus sp. THM7-7]|nr:hypothetical protein EWH99_12610 [Sporolactobacillus sp. THM7-7]
MPLQIVPIDQDKHISRLTDRSKKDLIKTIEKMQREIDHLDASCVCDSEVKRIVLREQLYGIKLAIVLTGHTLISQ